MRTSATNPAQQGQITPPGVVVAPRDLGCQAPSVTALGALLDDLPHQPRKVLRLHGPDTVRFLQGTVSADVHAAKSGVAVAATLLTVKAKIVSELVLLVHDDATIDLVIPADTFQAVESHLDRHIIMDQVELERREETCVAVVWGDTLPDPSAGLRWACRHPVQGQLLVGTQEEVAAALSEVTPADAAAFASHRIEVGEPAWGFEIRPDFFPPEVGFVGAVSYDKGCYLGQEPLARIHARGQVNRVMVRVRVEGAPQLPCPLAHAERAEAGTLTTVAGDRGLAVVRRSFAEEGQTMTGNGAEVIVTSGPLGDDPGMAGRNT